MKDVWKKIEDFFSYAAFDEKNIFTRDVKKN